MNPLSILGGLAGGGVSTSSTSGARDTSSGLEAAFAYQGAFNVGGSGDATQDAGQSTGGVGGSSSQMLLYIALGLAGVGAIVGILALAKK